MPADLFTTVLAKARSRTDAAGQIGTSVKPQRRGSDGRSTASGNHDIWFSNSRAARRSHSVPCVSGARSTSSGSGGMPAGFNGVPIASQRAFQHPNVASQSHSKGGGACSREDARAVRGHGLAGAAVRHTCRTPRSAPPSAREQKEIMVTQTFGVPYKDTRRNFLEACSLLHTPRPFNTISVPGTEYSGHSRSPRKGKAPAWEFGAGLTVTCQSARTDQVAWSDPGIVRTTPQQRADRARYVAQSCHREGYLDQYFRSKAGRAYKRECAAGLNVANEKTQGPKSTNSFKSYLRKTFGNVVRAWRLALDKDGNGKISFQELCVGARAIGFEGSIPALWADLDKNQDGSIAMEEIDPNASDELNSFRRHLLEKYTTAQAAWAGLCEAGQVKGLNTLKVEAFAEACAVSQYQPTSRHTYGTLHSYLDSNAYGHKYIVLKDLVWLGLPLEKDKLRSRADIEREMIVAKELTLGAKSRSEFVGFMKRRFGNVVRAWRLGLGQNGTTKGALGFAEFCEASRALGYEGSIRALWREMDLDNGGSIDLSELDPEMAAELDRFREFCKAPRLGSARRVWEALQEASGARGVNRIYRDQFITACRTLGYTGGGVDGSVDVLHRALNSEDMGVAKALKLSDLEWLGI